MSYFENRIGRDYAEEINTIARQANKLVAERKRLIKLMDKSGWIIYESRREQGQMAANYAPIINSIKRQERTVLEIESCDDQS